MNMKWVKYMVIILLAVFAFGLGTRCNIGWEAVYWDRETEEFREENAHLQNKLVELRRERVVINRKLGERNTLQEELAENSEKISEVDELWDNVIMLQNRLEEFAGDRDRAVAEMILGANETFYKMFYGKWQISSVIESENYDQEKAEDFIGRTVEYSFADIKVDGEKVISVPAYAYGIFPTEKQEIFFRSGELESPFINRQSDFFVYVSVETQSKGAVVQEYIFKQFFVVNDNMLILDADGTYFMMERVEYIKNHNYEMTIPDYYW